MENWKKKKKVTEVKLKRFNKPTYFGDKYNKGTDICLVTINCYTVRWTQNLYVNMDWQTEQRCRNLFALGPVLKVFFSYF